MSITRRNILKSAAWLSAALGTGIPAVAARSSDAEEHAPRDFRRIATEEAFSTKAVFGAHLELLANHPETEPGFSHFWESALGTPGEWIAEFSNVIGGNGVAGLADFISSTVAATGSESSVTSIAKLMDLGEDRIRIMDETGVAMQVISLASPGVQVFEADQATELASSSNDELSRAIQRHPSRFAGLAAIAPQSPEQAAKELERAVRQLGLKGAIINSHTKGEYLDEEKFRPILAKANELRVPLYLHPRTPSPQMLEPFTKYPGLAAATFGFNVETGLHALRLILSGVFDDYPDLTIVLGHMGEGLPFWIDRVDNRTAFIHSGPGPKPRKLKKKPSDYLRENFYITTSGMDFEPALMLAYQVVGPERMMFAIDHPMEDGRNPVRVLDNAPLKDDDKEKIYHRNAERLFGLS
ncbi:amidohydrolase [Pseudomaricurvus alkylphenolicus]|jgi:2,3-dihydroxybenzoate decarboxylase|uniref:amidohydrolase family protein n=1 Tax=Pseudomaricurvus alkylphenolicus TaxID=1306991 RepID=UPI00141DD592|nr:amidohydrolase family protein [Pseudomaricurvus alkylphenolicus]NIB43072.1 amidohydrolase [Pseudomaricurvus alkylphenolicus]